MEERCNSQRRAADSFNFLKTITMMTTTLQFVKNAFSKNKEVSTSSYLLTTLFYTRVIFTEVCFIMALIKQVSGGGGLFINNKLELQTRE